MEQEITFKDLYSENSSFFYTKEYFTGMNNFWETTKFEIENGLTKPLYLGYFVFAQKGKDRFECLRGNKLYIITIQLSALFLNLRSKRKLNEEEIAKYAKYVKSKTKYRLDWIKEEKQMFRDYVIDQIEVDRTKMKTPFSYQFDKYNDYFSNKDESFLLKWLNCIENATCTKIIQKAEKKPNVSFFINRFITATFGHSSFLTLSKKKMKLNRKREIRFSKIIQKKSQDITIEEQMALSERNKYINTVFEFTPAVCKNLLLLNEKLLEQEKRIFGLYNTIQKQCKEWVSSKSIDDYEIEIIIECWNDNYYKKFNPSINEIPFFETRCNFIGVQEAATYTELDFNDRIRLKAIMPKMKHCYSFHHLYDHTDLNWFDLCNIDSVWVEVRVKYQHFTTIK